MAGSVMTSVPAPEYRRRAQDAGEPSNAQLMERFDELDRRMSAWIEEHRRDHKELDAWRSDHVGDAKLRQYEIDKMSPDVAAAHDVKVRLDTIVDELRLVGVGVLLSILATGAHLLGFVK